MFKYAALVSYKGTQYCGWQKQKGSAANGAPSIQETFETALGRMTSEELSVVGSGRTDAGVNAAGQVVHFILKRKAWDPRILQRGLNSLLPIDIRVLEVRPVALEFHSQKSAVRKQYSYYFQQGPCALPALEPYSWWIQKRLDLEAMQRALDHLVGEHDFKPFQSSGSKPGPTVRRILEAEVSFERVSFPAYQVGSLGAAREGIGLVRVRLIGTGFLKQMVRGIAGTLLQVGEGRRASACIREILETRDRTAVGPTAPGRALWLERVWYPEHFELNW
ncbi:MAG: tRNA pseudouridine(38-40) synthase TruA [Oligoflexia bacterium]|nr:tRNA pseudouridine(38-40) synthase TruA [Oligoflexia bacterium]